METSIIDSVLCRVFWLCFSGFSYELLRNCEFVKSNKSIKNEIEKLLCRRVLPKMCPVVNTLIQ